MKVGDRVYFSYYPQEVTDCSGFGVITKIHYEGSYTCYEVVKDGECENDDGSYYVEPHSNELIVLEEVWNSPLNKALR